MWALLIVFFDYFRTAFFGKYRKLLPKIHKCTATGSLSENQLKDTERQLKDTERQLKDNKKADLKRYSIGVGSRGASEGGGHLLVKLKV